MGQSISSGVRLGAIVAAAATILTVVFLLTIGPIRDQESRAQMRQIAQILPSALYDNDLMSSSITVTNAALGRQTPATIWLGTLQSQPSAAVIRATAPDGYSGPIQLLIGMTIDGTVTGVRVLSHKETPGLGDFVDADVDEWIYQFDGLKVGELTADDWQIRRRGGRFDAMSGATVTAEAVINSTERATTWFNAEQASLFRQLAVESQ